MPRTRRLAAHAVALALAVLSILPACQRRRESAAPSTNPGTSPPPSLEDTEQARLETQPAHSSFYYRDIRTRREVACSRRCAKPTSA